MDFTHDVVGELLDPAHDHGRKEDFRLSEVQVLVDFKRVSSFMGKCIYKQSSMHVYAWHSHT